MIEPVVIEATLACTPPHAFDTWTERASVWWPIDHSATGASGFSIVYEPRVGGRIFERTPTGVEVEWGEILVWDRPTRLVYRWHPAPDRQPNPTEVEITFTRTPGGTALRLEHRGWDRITEGAKEWRDANVRGWNDLLPQFRLACR